tara:strand:- start:57 stop:566 length:510 start_codon:yes stop_codon:yes gene_type:complete
MKLGIPKKAERNITRMILRSIPLIPGPEIYDLFVDLRQGKKSINEKIEKAYVSLKDTSELISDLENDLVERTDKVKNLKEKYEDYSKLADIEEEKIQPLLNQLEKTVGKGKVAERIISFFINLIAGILIFLLGIWASPKIKEWYSKDNTKIEIQKTKKGEKNKGISKEK